MYTNIILPRRLSRLSCICRSVSSIEGKKLPQGSTSSDGISPPPRIPRGPTDILQALAATVGPDPTAAHYKYHDDPFLIPLSNYRKRAYALSAEAGRKAAAWVRDEHAELFTTRVWDPPMKKKTPHFNADPKISAFAPKPIYNDESKVTEDDLRYTINNALLEDSIKVFQLLGGADGVSEELKMDLLQLLCFYNEKEPDSEEWLEERWFGAVTRERQAATWRVGGLADKIFTSMEPKTPEAYCAVIQGMAKYYQAQRAEELLQEATENGIQLSTDVYNTMLGCIGFLREGVALRLDALKSLLVKMNQEGLTPNQETLSACLKSISVWGAGPQLKSIALEVVNEFRNLGIEPSLAAYYYLLCLFCKERGPRTDILSSILADLEKRETLEAVEPADTNFFITAMGVCSDHLQDVNMAQRVHALLMKGNNYKLVGDAYKESIYYRHYVTVHCRHAPFEKTTELLDTLVPNVYVPEPTVMDEIINTLELGGAGDRLAQAWSQIVIFGHAKRIKLIEKLLSALCSCYQYQDEEVKAKMRAAASDIIKFGQLAEERAETTDSRTPIAQKLSANALSNIIELCADSKDKTDVAWEAIAEALQRLRSQEAVGVPNEPTVLCEAAKKAVAVGMQGIAATALTYLAESGFSEASSGSQEVLAAMLNRSIEEIQQLLQKPKSELESALHPSALVVAEAYHLAQSGGAVPETASTSSDSSDGESSSDDE